MGASKGTRGSTLAKPNKPEASFLAIIQQMTQFMANIQEASSCEASRPPAFPKPSMEAKCLFYGTQPFKVRGSIQSFQLIFHNYRANFTEDKKKFLYGTSFFTGRAEKNIESFFPNLTNKGPAYLLNNWALLKSQLFTLFQDPNEAIKDEEELDGIRMKELGHFSLYISYFRSLVLRIGDWGRGLICIISGRDWPPGCWINWPPILQSLILFKT
ncbi:hypothetical protein O181_006757 [Austropuccinia psidii MF-1]|uniref:Uncharacterized protein n=1 Tax=Austropuccinia psidii MF-1 TaxID=1389203 RepID=A0A9Q3BLE3_9BASI|nr:hypothetical protein [Austropuccinia psidii MF-1]